MKLSDDVKVINDNYASQGIKAGAIGTIIEADIRWDEFFVCFQDQRVYDEEFMKNKQNVFKLNGDICLGIKIKDLIVVKDGNKGDDYIYDSLPENHKDCWCKVENGFIINLKGEKKNKTPYKYDT